MSWGAILAGTAVQAALIAALAFLARSIVLHWLAQNIETFKANLDAAGQRSVESYRADLAREAREHQIQFASLHAHQVAAIEALYLKLVETRHSLRTFVMAWRRDNRDQYVRVAQEVQELRRELDRRRIHLSEPLCLELDRFIALLWKLTVAAGHWPNVTDPVLRQKASDTSLESMRAVLDGGEMDGAASKIEGEFRRALGRLTMQ